MPRSHPIRRRQLDSVPRLNNLHPMESERVVRKQQDNQSRCEEWQKNQWHIRGGGPYFIRKLSRSSSNVFVFKNRYPDLCGLSVALVFALVPSSSEALKEGECEVCLSFLGKFYQSLQDNNVQFTSDAIEKALVKACKDAKGKENRFCYYIGATSDAATKIINEVSKPLSYHVPVEKVCEKLKKKDSQICELKYDKQVDLSTVDLKKLKVKDLKKILDEWGESCKGCAEKSDFIRKITELMPKYAPNAAKARTDL
ncbi:hypothetical protein PGIGA_G00120900 [Pangasianodon gigas]|uniref:Uncharacterized protein n=1 Tax=Pangasianodon gigas TaxID=30993 RepID=A0ACC5XGI8_PANGG|nr:hypothetical protein [Pangasianodon gigas]